MKSTQLSGFVLIHFNCSSVGEVKQKKKEDQDQLENPSDFKDPSVEQKERLLAIDEEIADDEDVEIAKTEPFASQNRSSLSPYLRYLVCSDETSKVFN